MIARRNQLRRAEALLAHAAGDMQEKRRIIGVAWREDHREDAKVTTKTWRRNNLEKSRGDARLRQQHVPSETKRIRVAAWKSRNPDKARKRAFGYRLKRLYGITPDDKARMIRAQRGRCWICRRLFTSSKTTHVDHCHRTGRVRGVLCSNCNTALGKFGDDPEMLARAILYLKK